MNLKSPYRGFILALASILYSSGIGGAADIATGDGNPSSNYTAVPGISAVQTQLKQNETLASQGKLDETAILQSNVHGAIVSGTDLAGVPAMPSASIPGFSNLSAVIASPALLAVQTAAATGSAQQPVNCAVLVTEAYNVILGRQPDSGGYAYWLGDCQSGDSETTILNDFLTSPEYLSHQPTISCDSYVNGLYSTVLGRAPDPGGQTNWDNVCNASNTPATRANMLMGFLTSSEFQNMAFNKILTSQEQAQWFQLCESGVIPGGSSGSCVDYFQILYQEWQQDSFKMLNNALANLTSAETSDPKLLEETLFIASLFVNPQEHTIQFTETASVPPETVTGVAYDNGSVLHLWNYEFSLSNGQITGVLDGGTGNSYAIPPVPLPPIVTSRVPPLTPVASNEGLIQIKVVNQYGNPVNGIFIGVSDGTGFQQIESNEIGTYTDSQGSAVTGVTFSGTTTSANVPLVVCMTSPTFGNCTYPTVSHVTAGGTQTMTVTVTVEP